MQRKNYHYEIMCVKKYSWGTTEGQRFTNAQHTFIILSTVARVPLLSDDKAIGRILCRIVYFFSIHQLHALHEFVQLITLGSSQQLLFPTSSCL